jgi:hypothetical protein
MKQLIISLVPGMTLATKAAASAFPFQKKVVGVLLAFILALGGPVWAEWTRGPMVWVLAAGIGPPDANGDVINLSNVFEAEEDCRGMQRYMEGTEAQAKNPGLTIYASCTNMEFVWAGTTDLGGGRVSTPNPAFKRRDTGVTVAASWVLWMSPAGRDGMYMPRHFVPQSAFSTKEECQGNLVPQDQKAAKWLCLPKDIDPRPLPSLLGGKP